MEKEVTERLVLMLLGVVEAQKCALSALIATHPNPELLHAAWHRSKPEWIDQSDEMNYFRSEDYQKGFVQALRAMSLAVDQSEADTRPDGPAAPQPG